MPSASDLPNLPTLFNDLGGSFGTLWDIVIAAAGIVFLVLLLIGGVQYLTSAGNDEQTKKAKTLLLDALIGIVLVVIAWPIGAYVLGLLGIADNVISGGKNIDPKSVLQSSDTTPSILNAGESAGAKLQSDAAGDGLSSGAGSDVLGSGGSGSRLSSSDVTIQLSSGEPGVTLTVTDSLGTTKITTDSEGEATLEDRKNDDRIEIRENDNTLIYLGDLSTIPETVAGKKRLLLDPSLNYQNGVNVRISILNKQSTKTLPNFEFTLTPTLGKDARNLSVVTGRDNGVAEVFLFPGVTYTFSSSQGALTTGQTTTYTPSDGLPKGTSLPAASWELFVKPNETYQASEATPPDIPETP